MIFNTTTGAGKKLPVLNPSFPADTSVTSGTNAVFRVLIDQEGMPSQYTYQWYVDGSPVPGATASEYTRDTASDKGVYSVYCVVTNKAGSVTSRAAALTVNALPVLNPNFPADAAVTLGGSVTCQVSVSTAGYPDSYSYQWYQNGTAVSGATGASFTVTPTAAGTTTVYCKVTNAAGTVTSRTASVTTDYSYLFNNGSLGLAGGFSFSQSSCSVESDSIYLYGVDSWAHGENAVDLTDYSRMTVEYLSDGYMTLTAGFVESFGMTSFAASVSGMSDSRTTMTLDISSLSGAYYLALRGQSNTEYSHYCNIYKIYLE